jgi:predicted flap endonuclease-1-like 5' DNA nuclease
MIDAGQSLRAAQGLSGTDLVAYLVAHGWTALPSRIDGVLILSKELPGTDGPVEFILPTKPGFDDEHRRLADALRTIEAVEDRPMLTIVDEVWRVARQGKVVPAGDQVQPVSKIRQPNYPITVIEGVDPDAAKALKSVGIRTTEKLLEAAKSPEGRRLLAVKTELDEKMLLRWANIADKLRIKGMGKEYAGLLQEVGVDTVRELQFRNPARLALSMAEANNKRKLVRFSPSEKTVARWVEEAKKLPLVLT